MAFTSLGRVRQRVAVETHWKNRRSKVRRTFRRNRVLVVTLLAVGALVAVLIGVGGALPVWFPYQLTGAPPGARFGAAAAFDEANKEVLVFGGFGSVIRRSGFTGIATTPLQGTIDPAFKKGDTWSLIFDGAGVGRWIDRTQSALHAPSPRGFAAMAYDGARRNVVLFGGGLYRDIDDIGREAGGPVYGDTWIWDGKDWALQNPPEPRPDARRNAVMVYDAHRKVVMMFGGRGAEGLLNDTWVWNGSYWKIIPPEGAPSPRHSAAIAYDLCRGEAVMFGGVGPPETPGGTFVPQPSQTWTWNGVGWHQETPQVSPPARIGASMAYSPYSGRVVLYGGLATSDAGNALAATDPDAWRWDKPSNSWEKLNSEAGTVASQAVFQVVNLNSTVPPPAPRAYAAFTWGGSVPFWGDMFSLYGGTPSGPGLPQVAFGDQYRFHDTGDFPDPSAGEGEFGGSETPLTRRCRNPVPIPEEGSIDAPVAPETRKIEVREGMRETGKLPVLLGADWPWASRNTHTGPPSNRTPNPSYTPPPDCPNHFSSENLVRSEDGRSTFLIADPKRNRVYQFFICDPDRGQNQQGQNNPYVHNLLIEAYHGATLKPVGRAVVQNTALSGVTSLLPFRLFHDVDRGRFFIRSTYWNGSANIDELVVIGQDLIEKGADPVVKRITPGQGTERFFNHPKTGRLKLFKISNVPSPTAFAGSTGTFTLIQHDFEDDREDWRVDVAGCLGIDSTTWMRAENHVLALCYLGSNNNTVVSIPVVEDPAHPDGEKPGTPELVGRIPYAQRTWGDPQGGRMLIYAHSLSGSVIWPFDAKASRFVGRTVFSTNLNGSPYNFGLDRETGRFYTHAKDSKTGNSRNQGGIQIVDTRLTPVPQGIKFPQFASIPSDSPIAALPAGPGVPRRVFYRSVAGTMQKYPDGDSVQMENEMFYRVLADEIPLPDEPGLSDLDVLTIPTPEAPGKTEVSFDAEGSGYGIRLRSVGGVWSALRPFRDIHERSLEAFDATSNAGHLNPGCLFPDRELVAGWVPQARLSDLDAAARSSGLEVDPNSKTDLEGPFSRCQPPANAAHFPSSAKPVFDILWPLWQMVQLHGDQALGYGTVTNPVVTVGAQDTPAGPLSTLTVGAGADGEPLINQQTGVSTGWGNYFKEVECVGDALATNTANVGNIYGSAECVQRQGLVKATARGSATGAGPLGEETSSRGFSVGEGYSTVTVARDPVKGVVVTSTAVARGIQLPGTTVGDRTVASLSIDRVETKAVAWSNGRPGEERASFDRKICGVHTPDGSIPGCLTAAQQQQFVDNWNRGGGVNSKMHLPKYDPEMYQGSPGGYIAGVVKPQADEIDDQLFAKDYQREVAGLVIEFYKDSNTQGLGRQVLQLAGVRAVAGLGVQCNPDYIFSPQANECVALSFGDDFDTQYFEEDEEDFFEEEEFEGEGEWIAVEASGLGESLGSKIGRFLENLPVIRQLPIRQMGEALLLASVWMLLGLPLFFASRRFALNQWRSN